jgi:hypothetical protein
MNKEVAGYVGYIFQCESNSVVEDILQGLRSAFISAHEAARFIVRSYFRNCSISWGLMGCRLFLI